MSEEFVMNVGSEAIKTITLIAGPMLLAAMVIGIIVSVLQAVTQIESGLPSRRDLYCRSLSIAA
jgi:flagellar biosynthetic protein FliQ